MSSTKTILQDSWSFQCGNSTVLIPKKIFILSAFVLVIIILLIAIIVLATRSPKIAKIISKPSDCLHPSCVIFAGEMLRFLDTSVDPCDNFYQYACGNWIHESFVEDNEKQQSAMTAQTRKVNHRLKRILESKSENPTSSMNKLQTAYEACISINDSVSEVTIQKHINDTYGGWPMATGPNWASENNIKILDDVFTSLLVPIKQSGNAGILFQAYVSEDIYKSEIIPILSLPAKYPKVPENDETKEQLVTNMVRNAQQFASLGNKKFDEVFATKAAWDVLNLTEAIYNAAQLETGDTFALYESMTFEKFTDVTGFPWLNFAQKFFKSESSNEIKQEDKLGVINKQYFKTIHEYLKALTTWSSIIDYEVISTLSELRAHTKSHTADPAKPRWQFCVEILQEWFPEIIAYEYMKEFLEVDKEQLAVQIILEGVEEVFKKRLEEINWLNETSRNKLLIKLDKMKNKFWAPDWTKDTKKLDEFYQQLNIGPDHISNYINIKTFLVRNNLKLLSEKLTFTRWPKAPTIVNAFYNPTENSMYLPAGILQPPVFHSSRLHAMNFGNLGVVIGHEITHGYDSTGKKFNENGKLENMFTDHDIAAFDERAQCFINQYNEYSLTPEDLPGTNLTVYINGSQTVNENIADNGGIQQAFWAYKNWVDKNGNEKLPESLKNYTAEQIFFMSFAQFWCTKYPRQTDASKTVFIKDILSGPHSPGKARVLGSLSNFDEFAKAFSCKSTSKMVNKKSCKLW